VFWVFPVRPWRTFLRNQAFESLRSILAKQVGDQPSFLLSATNNPLKKPMILNTPPLPGQLLREGHRGQGYGEGQQPWSMTSRQRCRSQAIEYKLTATRFGDTAQDIELVAKNKDFGIARLQHTRSTRRRPPIRPAINRLAG